MEGCLSIENDLAKVRDWAQEKAQRGQEPPWAWYQYMKLIESVNAILAGIAAVVRQNSIREKNEPDLEFQRLCWLLFSVEIGRFVGCKAK
jgi:hypothetical protein